MSDQPAGPPGESLRVEVVRSGGFAGLTRRAVRDTADLPPDDAARLRELTDAARLSFRLKPPSPGADMFSYRVTVSRGRRRRRRSYSELSMPPGVRELVDFVCAGS